MASKRRIALVYGATGDIGRHVARELADNGWKLAIVSRSKERAQDLCTDLGGQHLAVECKGHEFSRAIRQVEDSFNNPISACINASGIVKDNLLLRTKEEELDQMMSCNLLNAIYLNKAAVKSMLRNKSTQEKSIINIGSVIGSDGNAGQVAYSASKAGLHGLTKSLAKEVGNRGIRVNLVEPGFIKSKMTANTQIPIDRIALQRVGTPQDVANLVSFLVSEKAAYITGQIIRIDGGLTI